MTIVPDGSCEIWESVSIKFVPAYGIFLFVSDPTLTSLAKILLATPKPPVIVTVPEVVEVESVSFVTDALVAVRTPTFAVPRTSRAFVVSTVPMAMCEAAKTFVEWTLASTPRPPWVTIRAPVSFEVEWVKSVTDALVAVRLQHSPYRGHRGFVVSTVPMAM